MNTTKPLAYVINEIEVTDPAVYQTFLDRHTPIVQAAGGRYLSRGEKLVALDGMVPRGFAIIQFDSMEQAQAYRDRDKGSKFRSFIAQGSVSATVGK